MSCPDLCFDYFMALASRFAIHLQHSIRLCKIARCLCSPSGNPHPLQMPAHCNPKGILQRPPAQVCGPSICREKVIYSLRVMHEEVSPCLVSRDSFELGPAMDLDGALMVVLVR